jgi:hypothetical protein
MQFPRLTLRRFLVASVLALAIQRIVLGFGDGQGHPDTAPPAAATPAETAPARAEHPGILVKGCAVDDETGAPIETYTVEASRGEGPETSKRSWGTWARHVPGSFSRVNGRLLRIPNPRGEFTYSVSGRDVETQHPRWLRVVADGYEPRRVFDRPIDRADFGKPIEVTVRLRRGRSIVGRVVDHAGRPAAGARLFLVRPSGGRVTVSDDVIGRGSDVGLVDPSVTRAVADEQGRFLLTGVGDAEVIGVSAPNVHLWTTPVAEPGEEPTFRLPEPATIRLPYTIDGDEPRAEFSLQYHVRLDPVNRLTVWRNIQVDNGGETILHDASPGAYGLWRLKSQTIGDYHRRDHVEYRAFSVEPGGAATVDFVRESGGRIEGKVSGPDGEQARMIFVGIEPRDAIAARGWPPRSPRSLMDIVACDADGRFQTARIPPGEYVARAVGYLNRPRYGPFIEFMEPIDFSGSTPVTVAADGAPPALQIAIVGLRRPGRPAK